MGNTSLGAARKAKQDEFYTQWADIEREMNAYLEYDPEMFRGKTILLPCDDPEWSNFSKFFALHFMDYGIKKLISTSYAPKSNADGAFYTPTLFDDPQFDESIDDTHGKIFVLEPEDITGDGKVNIDDLKWSYLEGDGDFRSDEVTKLRDLADIVITNPPFSLFREFIAWLIEGNVLFSVIGSKNSITYKEIFPLIRGNKLWFGNGFHAGNAYFRVPENLANEYAQGVYDEDTSMVHFRNVNWFTNIEHGRRHEPLSLMTMEQNLLYGSKRVREVAYPKYDNYDAIEVPETLGIPSDFDGLMGVPISFLDKYSPEQFEIVSLAAGNSYANTPPEVLEVVKFVPRVPGSEGAGQGVPVARGKKVYARILIRHRNPVKKED